MMMIKKRVSKAKENGMPVDVNEVAGYILGCKNVEHLQVLRNTVTDRIVSLGGAVDGPPPQPLTMAVARHPEKHATKSSDTLALEDFPNSLPQPMVQDNEDTREKEVKVWQHNIQVTTQLPKDSDSSKLFKKIMGNIQSGHGTLVGTFLPSEPPSGTDALKKAHQQTSTTTTPTVGQVEPTSKEALRKLHETVSPAATSGGPTPLSQVEKNLLEELSKKKNRSPGEEAFYQAMLVRSKA